VHQAKILANNTTDTLQSLIQEASRNSERQGNMPWIPFKENNMVAIIFQKVYDTNWMGLIDAL
jgi:hypothetical protein